jgi:hypothetical protein
MSQVRPKGEKVGEIAARAVVQLPFSARYEDVHAFVHKLLRGGKPMPYLPPLMSAISFKLTHIFSP